MIGLSVEAVVRNFAKSECCRCCYAHKEKGDSCRKPIVELDRPAQHEYDYGRRGNHKHHTEIRAYPANSAPRRKMTRSVKVNTGKAAAANPRSVGASLLLFTFKPRSFT